MSRCWAHSLGGCNQMSGEHVFNSAVLSHGCSCPIVIEGVSRIQGGKPTRNAEKANILCHHHNSSLSALDEIAGRVAAWMVAANDEAFDQWLYIDGEKLQRWLLKTVVNAAAAGWAGPRKWRPSSQIVSAIYGQSEVPHGLGLYSVNGIDLSSLAQGAVSMTPLIGQKPGDPQLLGAYVGLHGLPLLYAFHDGLAHRLESGEIADLTGRFSSDGLRHQYRPGGIVNTRKMGAPIVMGLSWSGVFRFADGTMCTEPPASGWKA